MRQAPIVRKMLAAVPCVLLSLMLVGSLAGSIASSSSGNAASGDANRQGQTAAESANSESKADDQGSDEATKAEQGRQPETAGLGDLKATFIDVGQGDSEFVLLPDGKTMLIDAGEVVSGSTVAQFLTAQNIKKIDYLVATHPHSDHIGVWPT